MKKIKKIIKKKETKSKQHLSRHRGILADCVDELQPFIEEVLPNEEQDNALVTEGIAITANWKTYVRFWLYFLYFL